MWRLYQYLPVGLGCVKSGVGVGRLGCGVCPGLGVPWGGGEVGRGVCTGGQYCFLQQLSFSSGTM